MPGFDPIPAKRPEFLMRLLFDAYSWFDESLQQSMHAHGVPALSRSQSMVMILLGEGIHRPVALARKLRISRQAMHKTLADLEEKGYLRLVPDPEDGRAKIVRLSRTGVARRSKAWACLADLEKALAARVGKGNVAALYKALQAEWGESPGKGTA